MNNKVTQSKKDTERRIRPDIYNDDSFDDSSEVNNNDLRVKSTKKNEEKKPRKTKSPIKSFFTKVLLTLLCIILSIALFAFLVSLFLPTKTTFLIMATDYDGTRTDSMIFGVYDKNEKSVSLLSIPRDTYVTVDDDTYSLMRDDFPQPSSRSMKINTVHHYGGEEFGVKMALEQTEKLLGQKIDFYAKINFDAFRYIIDEVGGVDFYVPQRMEYHDPLQNLHISLSEGQQVLSGTQAEQLLRFRSGYANADLGRVEVQQQFLKAFMSQVFSSKSIMSRPLSFVKLVLNPDLLDTNANFLDVLAYLFTINGLDMENMSSDTLPGYPAQRGGQSVYIHNESQTSQIVSDMMN